MMYYVYVLYSKVHDRFYIGMTNDLDRRITEHRFGTTYTTSRMKDFQLVYYEACRVKEDATARESQLKTGFGRGYLRKRVAHDIVKRSVGQ